ncbi:MULTISPECIES: choline-sulfatase [unclassified Ensifer]|uniref:choline-sulfatase n=1 Tax=unclassified Ensifer TaxID=2633371 RepID=UPI000813BA84|nr:MULTISPECIES: choline-sulfatase [unclassified Ensifer]OCP07182.1 choline-sulfatase [Ensifer sp. LC11]OCP07766.1 choline-sulfatase [Ensifer sp. LC13]OCP12072.1 choline-sulfatase [Ensifer sp. LC14]OCP31782.1 choline-sulfatase [Ensifer sp. LC499]
MTARPNILIIMVDQLNGKFFPDGPAAFLHAPNLKALAARSARFRNNYTSSPLCAPARASFMAGQLPSRTRVYDNAAEYQSSIPTYAHHLRRAGYYTALSGKMHFVGPDQLHGFEERLTTDIYPADFGWTPDYRKPGERIDWWYHNLGSVTGAGVAEITNQMEYDDEVAFLANQKLYQLSRENDDADRRPWCLTVSFTHPHDPYVARKKFWDLYEDCEHLLPEIGMLPEDQLDPHSRRIMHSCDYVNFDLTEDNIRRSRRAYFANISYLDEKVGELVDTLTRTRMLDDTLILFCSDHGDMLGERGLWFKMNFFEGSARVPLMVAGPGVAPGLHVAPTSNLDVTPTLADLAGISMEEVKPWTDGISLVPMINGQERSEPVLMEYAAEASYAPLVAIREGKWKYIHCALDPDQLYDLDADPLELKNLAANPETPVQTATLQAFRDMCVAHWDMEAFDAAVRESQARRWVVYEALRNGAYYPWDHQPLLKASERYMRNHMNLDNLEESKRYPRGE